MKLPSFSCIVCNMGGPRVLTLTVNSLLLLPHFKNKTRFLIKLFQSADLSSDCLRAEYLLCLSLFTQRLSSL